MHKAYKAAVLAAALIGGSGPALGQTQTPSPDKPEWSDITQVVVRSRIPGPALWKLSKGGSTVWVLGTLYDVPAKLHWDSSRLKRMMAGARVVIMPPTQTISRKQVFDYLEAAKLPDHTLLRAVVTPQTYKRFLGVVTREHLSVDTYTGYRPFQAGYQLFSDVLDEHRINSDAMVPELTGMAQAAGVEARPVYATEGEVLFQHHLAMDAASSEACFNDYLNGVDYDLHVLPGLANAWARGDMAAVTRAYKDSSYLTCDLRGGGWDDTYKSAVIDKTTAAIDTALATPGHSVAVVDLSTLLRKGGVLDHLRAEGVDITSPAE